MPPAAISVGRTDPRWQSDIRAERCLLGAAIGTARVRGYADERCVWRYAELWETRPLLIDEIASAADKPALVTGCGMSQSPRQNRLVLRSLVATRRKRSTEAASSLRQADRYVAALFATYYGAQCLLIDQSLHLRSPETATMRFVRQLANFLVVVFLLNLTASEGVTAPINCTGAWHVEGNDCLSSDQRWYLGGDNKPHPYKILFFPPGNGLINPSAVKNQLESCQAAAPDMKCMMRPPPNCQIHFLGQQVTETCK
jgi:hypothetical protein